MGRPSKYAPEVRARAIRMVQEHRPEYPSQWAAITSIAAKLGFVVDSYVDEAFGILEKNAEGKLLITRITLRPNVQFSADKLPTADELRSMHHSAHEQCFIANTLKSEIVVDAS